MRSVIIVPIVVAVLAWVPGPAAAQSRSPSEDEQLLEPEKSDARPSRGDAMDDEDLDEQVFYSGFGLSRAEADFSNLEPATNIEGVMGFRIPTLPWFGIEIDIAQTLIPGENTPCGGVLGPPCAASATSDPDEFGMQALGASLALKSLGRFYVTGKYGYRYVYTSIAELNEQRSGNGFAVGAGYRWGRGLSGVELGYKQLAEDVDAIGLTFFVRPQRR